MEPIELIKAAILAVDVSKAAKVKNITPQTEIRDLGLDSVATMEMVGYLEEKLDIQFADEVMVRVNTFGDLIKLVESAKK